MAKGSRRRKAMADKRARKTAQYASGAKGTSNYARKRAWCQKNGKWGFEVGTNLGNGVWIGKPWKKARVTTARAA